MSVFFLKIWDTESRMVCWQNLPQLSVSFFPCCFSMGKHEWKISRRHDNYKEAEIDSCTAEADMKSVEWAEQCLDRSWELD